MAVIEAFRVSRLDALRKPEGSVRALVVGEVLRRLIGKVLAQSFALQLQQACLPCEFASVRAGRPYTCSTQELRAAAVVLLRYTAHQYLLRVLPPALTAEDAAGHDAAVAACLTIPFSG